MSDFPVDAKSDDDLEREADELLKALGLDPALGGLDALDVVARAARTKLKSLSGLVLEMISNREMDLIDPTAEAYAEFDPPRIVVRKRVMDGVIAGNPRDTMTVFHELMHIWLGHRGVRKFRKTVVDNVEFLIPKPKSAERQATVAAAAFQAPLKALRDLRDPIEVMRRFGLSMQAAEIRLERAVRFRGRKAPIEVKQFLDTSAVMPSRKFVSEGPQFGSFAAKLWNDSQKCPGLDPAVSRISPQNYRIDFDQYLKMTECGWSVDGGRIVAYLHKKGS